MQKAYSRINWENYPSTETPLNETNLNKIDEALNTVDNRVVEFDTTKANQVDLLTCVNGITLNTSSGILTISFKNGTSTQIDTGLAKLAVNFDYDEDPTSPHYQQLILEMKDGTYKYIDLSAMITQFEFDNTSTVAFTVNAQTGHISAIVPDGSITAEKLNPNVVVTMQAIEDAAEADALKAEGLAVGEQNGVPVGPGSPYYQNNAKYYCEEAQGGGSGGHVIKDETDTFIQRTGLKFIGKVNVSDDVIGGNTVVEVEASGAVPHLIVISDTGSTVTATKGTTVITAVETSNEHFECDLVMEDPQDIYGTWVIDAILAGDDAQVSLNVDTIKVYTVDDSHFHADIVVTYPDGATVSCSKTGEQTMYATGSPYTFTVHSAGIWTITGTRGEATVVQTVNITTSGQTESVTLTIILDGSTATPTDDVQILLNCADIWDKTTYTTIADLIADDTSLLAVLTSDNAIDYLVRSTTFASAITADEDAMVMIGSYDYASNTLLSDSTWNTAIQNSAYFESVDNTKIPTMTSDTTPSGQVIYSSQGSNNKAYQAFGESGLWSSDASTTQYIGYIFTASVRVFKIRIVNRTSSTPKAIQDFKLQASNDGTNWTDIESYTNSVSTSDGSSEYINTNYSESVGWRLYITSEYDGNSGASASVIQFYGRQNGGVQSWLKAGGIDEPYTTLAEVFADTTTLSALIASHDAVDYLVTAKALIDGIVADATAMSYIGLNNYCANTLLNDSDWLKAICNSTYFESVLNVKVPTMTSNTTPSGTVIFGTENSGYPAWYAFDKDPSTRWTGTSYIGYIFTEAKKIYKCTARATNNANQAKTIKAQGSNDGSTWTNLSEEISVTLGETNSILIDGEYSRFRLLTTARSGQNYASLGEVQFYGREDA